MIETKFIEMMNLELDGALGESDSASLHEHLSSHPEAARYFEDLRAALAAVDAVGQADPPPGLGTRIIGAVPFVGNGGRGTDYGRPSWRERWHFMPRFRYAAVFVFGLFFGVLVYSAINYDNGRGGNGVDISEFLGTMRQITSADGFRQTRAIGVDFDQVRGSVSLHESSDVMLAEVTLDSSDEIEWVVEYNAGEVTFDGYRSFSGESGNIVTANREMRVHQSGETRYLLFFTRLDPSGRPDPSGTATSLTVKIYSADQLLLEQSISPAAKSAD
jgi:hypothetical protein